MPTIPGDAGDRFSSPVSAWQTTSNDGLPQQPSRNQNLWSAQSCGRALSARPPTWQSWRTAPRPKIVAGLEDSELSFPPSESCGITVISTCVSTSTLGRANASGRTRGAGSASRKYRCCSPSLTGWINGRMRRSSIGPGPSVGWFEVRQDEGGEILHLVTLWRATKEEVRLYEDNS